jgi:hypothetical protein
MGFVGHTGLESASIIGLVNLCGISFIDLIGHISLDDSLALWNHWPISLIGIIGFGLIASSASAISLAHRLISLVSLGLAAALIAAKTIGILLLWLEQKASHGVAVLQISATEITNSAASYYRAVSLLHVCSFVREKMCWWLALAKEKMWLWIASFGDSYNNEVLQYEKQLVSLRLPQMTKY